MQCDWLYSSSLPQATTAKAYNACFVGIFNNNAQFIFTEEITNYHSPYQGSNGHSSSGGQRMWLQEFKLSDHTIKESTVDSEICLYNRGDNMIIYEDSNYTVRHYYTAEAGSYFEVCGQNNQTILRVKASGWADTSGMCVFLQ